MRFLLVALLFIGPASAQAPQAVESVTFTRSELDALQEELEKMVSAREAAAYQRGQMDVRQRCASLI
jgi:hypothetical protein